MFVSCVFLTRVHELPQLVDQSFITQSRVCCLGEWWILTEQTQDLMSVGQEQKHKIQI